MTTVTLPAATLADAVPHQVHTRQFWNDAWTLRPYLFALEVKHTVMPEISQAVLEWTYGNIIQHDSASFAVFSRLDLLNHYVRITIAPGEADEKRWYGQIQEVDDARAGGTTGRQKAFAFGLESLLRRSILRHSIVGAGETRINRALPFNEDNARKNTGNRSMERGPNGAYVFADDLNDATWWSTKDIVEYLFTYHAPTDKQGEVKLNFRFSFSAIATLHDWDRPKKTVHGMTLDQVLLDLVDRSRFLAWTVDVDETQSPTLIDLLIYSFAPQQIILPGGGRVSPNLVLKDADIDATIWNDVTPLRTSATHEVEKITVRGARATSTFCLSPLDGTLEADWTAAQEADYESAASGIPGYAGLDVDEQERANMLARSADKLRRVFASFKLPDDWDGLVNDGEAGLGVVVWFPRVGPDGGDDELNPEPAYRPAFRFLDRLPAIKEHEIVDEATEFVAPFALLRIHVTDSRYAMIDRLGQLGGVEGLGLEGDGPKWSAHVRMADHDAAVSIKISGRPQHIIAGADFLPLVSGAEVPVEYDWRDNLICTVAAEADRYVEVSVIVGAEEDDVIREIVIDLEDRARLDWLAEGCVTGIQADGTLVRNADGTFSRDDRSWMTDLANLAAEWYRSPRISFALEIRQHFRGFDLGDLITEVGAGEALTEVNSLVTSITYDLARARTVVSTDFADINFRALVV